MFYTLFLSFLVSPQLNTTKFSGQINSLWKAYEKHEVLEFINYRKKELKANITITNVKQNEWS